jgi:hypothetical protein
MRGEIRGRYPEPPTLPLTGVLSFITHVPVTALRAAWRDFGVVISKVKMRYKKSCREKETDRKLEMADAAPDAEEPEVVQ